jgi:poly-gamma-glutamate synthesis protein (capsule biosynthesis protein)
VAAANAADDPGRDYDYASLLAPIAPLVGAADWAVCHLEVPLSADNTRLHPYPTFRVPGDIARDAAATGFDACTTASNHVLDQGPSGVIETLDVLDAAGLRHTGSARSAAEARHQPWVDVAGVRVAHLAYAYGFNGFTVPSGAPWMANLINEDTILADATSLRRQGAEFVIVSLHWGEQYQAAPNRQQRDLGPRLLASPAVDLVIGHHAHVVQPIDLVDGEWLVYGMGNLLSASSSPARRDELLVEVTVTVAGDGTVTTGLRAVPLYLDRASLVVYPSSPALHPSGLDAGLQAELDASQARTRSVLETGTGWGELTFGPDPAIRAPVLD